MKPRRTAASYPIGGENAASYPIGGENAASYPIGGEKAASYLIGGEKTLTDFSDSAVSVEIGFLSNFSSGIRLGKYLKRGPSKKEDKCP